MTIPTTRRQLMAGASAVLSASAAAPALGQKRTGGARLEQVAAFPHQVTGVAVAKDGRVFVNFPRWTEDSPVSVAEVKSGKAVAYPDLEWNSWRNAKQDDMSPNDHFVCVQSVVAHGDSLWVLDPAAPAMEQVIKGGPKLVRIDLATNKVARTYLFDERSAPQGTYLNDIRFSPDGKWGYLTDSGRGAILTINIETGAIRRVLDGVSSTQAEKGVLIQIDGRPLRRPDGKAPSFAADGLALSSDGETLYWQAISSRTLYAVPTAALRDEAIQTTELETRVRKVGTTMPADGLWMSVRGQFLFTVPEESAVKVREAESRFTTVVQDKRLRWPDSLAEGPDGAIYVTASHIPDNRMFKLNAPVATPSALYRFTPPR